jgi:LTXXQ motif family protein
MRALVLIAVVLTAVPITTPAFQSPAAAPRVRPTLTEAQKQMLKSAETDLASKMTPLAEKVSRAAKDLNRALVADKADSDAQRKLADDLANAVSGLAAEAIRLRVSALRGIVDSLSPEQKSLLRAELDKPGADADLLNVIKKVFEEEKR